MLWVFASLRSTARTDEARAASPLTSGCENADVFEEAGRSVDEDLTSTRPESEVRDTMTKHDENLDL